ncbi:ATP-binding protein [Methylobacterium sp. HMF5984]|uniref:ATP-binding protein n=1 Tax=Methylobacterium sp. HMF5984 TaxID=3367370 RepID=UPI003855177B
MAVSLMLNSAFPMFLAWGPGLGFLYNDAYVEILGAKHPAALGEPFERVWSEIWDDIRPLVERATGGEATFREDLPLVMMRRGYPEDVWFTFSYSPLRGEDGSVQGMFCACTETTAKVREERRNAFLLALGDAMRIHDDPDDLIAAACGMLGRHLGVQRCGFGEADAAGVHYTVERDWTDGTMPSLVGIHRLADFGEAAIGELRAGRSLRVDDVPSDPRTAPSAASYEGIGTLRALLSVPLAMEGRLWASVFVNQSVPRRWTDDEEALVRDVAGRIFTALQRARAEAGLAESAMQLEEALAATQESRTRLSVALDVARLGTFDWNTVTGEVAMDERAREIFGLPSVGVIHQGEVFGVIAPDEVAGVTAAAEAGFRDGARVDIGYTIILPDGDRRSILSAGHPVDTSGLRHMVGIFNDVTALRQAEADLRQANQTLEQRVGERTRELMAAEEALRQSQKLEAIGQLTGGVAHDFNNLLTVIKSSTDLLKRPDLAAERRDRYVAAISDTVDRAAKLTGQLLAFARRQALKPEVFAACDSVRSLSDMVGTLTGSRIEIVTDLPERTCFVHADPSQFDTALVNMAVNARDAMDGEGRLDIRVRAVEAMPAIRTHAAIPGAFVAVSIRDTGSGIPEERLERIFEPFFTTKGVGQGTGLGLSQVFGFAKQSGGEVTVESEVGRGTTFTLYLPQVAEETRAPDTGEPEPLMDGHGTCVLVVEDNADVGTFAVQTLTDLGYVPVLAGNAEEALAELARDADRFDVVFTDVVMPGMNGIDLAHRIREEHHDLPVLLASGYSHVLARNGTYGFELLHKPYSVEQLSRLLRKVATWQRRKRILGAT